SPVAPAHTRPPPARLADSVGWSATPSSGSSPRCGPPYESFARPPVAAAPRRVARFVPAADRRSAIYPIAAAPTWTTEPELFSDLPCPSNTLGHLRRQVSTCITLYVVIVLDAVAQVVVGLQIGQRKVQARWKWRTRAARRQRDWQSTQRT